MDNNINTDRFTESSESITVCKNENMLCTSCRYSMGLAAECEKYRTKPMYVIDGADHCPKYERTECEGQS